MAGNLLLRVQTDCGVITQVGANSNELSKVPLLLLKVAIFLPHIEFLKIRKSKVNVNTGVNDSKH